MLSPMKRTLFLKSLTSFVISLTLFSCQDHLTTPTGPQRFRLKRTVFSAATLPSNSVTTYNYNNSGKLASIISAAGSDSTQYTLVYNSQGQLASREGRNTLFGQVRLLRNTYEYDATGNLTTIKSYSDLNQNAGSLALIGTIQIEYNADRLPQTVTSTAEGVTQTATYTYGNGNIVRIDYSASSSGQPASSSTFTYDDKRNPYYGLIGSLTGIVDIINRSNIIEPNVNYQYDSNGLLISRATSRLSARTTFEYETY